MVKIYFSMVNMDGGCEQDQGLIECIINLNTDLPINDQYDIASSIQPVSLQETSTDMKSSLNGNVSTDRTITSEKKQLEDSPESIKTSKSTDSPVSPDSPEFLVSNESPQPHAPESTMISPSLPENTKMVIEQFKLKSNTKYSTSYSEDILAPQIGSYKYVGIAMYQRFLEQTYMDPKYATYIVKHLATMYDGTIFDVQKMIKSYVDTLINDKEINKKNEYSKVYDYVSKTFSISTIDDIRSNCSKYYQHYILSDPSNIYISIFILLAHCIGNDNDSLRIVSQTLHDTKHDAIKEFYEACKIDGDKTSLLHFIFLKYVDFTYDSGIITLKDVIVDKITEAQQVTKETVSKVRNIAKGVFTRKNKNANQQGGERNVIRVRPLIPYEISDISILDFSDANIRSDSGNVKPDLLQPPSTINTVDSMKTMAIEVIEELRKYQYSLQNHMRDDLKDTWESIHENEIRLFLLQENANLKNILRRSKFSALTKKDKTVINDKLKPCYDKIHEQLTTLVTTSTRINEGNTETHVINDDSIVKSRESIDYLLKRYQMIALSYSCPRYFLHHVLYPDPNVNADPSDKSKRILFYTADKLIHIDILITFLISYYSEVFGVTIDDTPDQKGGIGEDVIETDKQEEDRAIQPVAHNNTSLGIVDYIMHKYEEKDMYKFYKEVKLYYGKVSLPDKTTLPLQFLLNSYMNVASMIFMVLHYYVDIQMKYIDSKNGTSSDDIVIKPLRYDIYNNLENVKSGKMYEFDLIQNVPNGLFLVDIIQNPSHIIPIDPKELIAFIDRCPNIIDRQLDIFTSICSFNNGIAQTSEPKEGNNVVEDKDSPNVGGGVQEDLMIDHSFIQRFNAIIYPILKILVEKFLPIFKMNEMIFQRERLLVILLHPSQERVDSFFKCFVDHINTCLQPIHSGGIDEKTPGDEKKEGLTMTEDGISGKTSETHFIPSRVQFYMYMYRQIIQLIEITDPDIHSVTSDTYKKYETFYETWVQSIYNSKEAVEKQIAAIEEMTFEEKYDKNVAKEEQFMQGIIDLLKPEHREMYVRTDVHDSYKKKLLDEKYDVISHSYVLDDDFDAFITDTKYALVKDPYRAIIPNIAIPLVIDEITQWNEKDVISNEENALHAS